MACLRLSRDGKGGGTAATAATRSADRESTTTSALQTRVYKSKVLAPTLELAGKAYYNKLLTNPHEGQHLLVFLVLIKWLLFNTRRYLCSTGGSLTLCPKLSCYSTPTTAAPRAASPFISKPVERYGCGHLTAASPIFGHPIHPRSHY